MAIRSGSWHACEGERLRADGTLDSCGFTIALNHQFAVRFTKSDHTIQCVSVIVGIDGGDSRFEGCDRAIERATLTVRCDLDQTTTCRVVGVEIVI